MTCCKDIHHNLYKKKKLEKSLVTHSLLYISFEIMFSKHDLKWNFSSRGSVCTRLTECDNHLKKKEKKKEEKNKERHQKNDVVTWRGWMNWSQDLTLERSFPFVSFSLALLLFFLSGDKTKTSYWVYFILLAAKVVVVSYVSSFFHYY